MRTISERLFETYSNLRGYECKRIEVDGEGRFADYELMTPRGTVICEVKEITPNVEDKAYDERLAKYNQADSSRPIGKRARATLVNASGQLRRFREDPSPCMAVLFDKTYYDYLSPSDIDAAMFGDPIVLFPIEPPDRGVDVTHGGNRRLNEERGLYISAVGVLRRAEPQGTVGLDIYHNPFTSKRIRPAYFPDLIDRHFFKKGHPDESGHGWSEYVGPRSDA